MTPTTETPAVHDFRNLPWLLEFPRHYADNVLLDTIMTAATAGSKTAIAFIDAWVEARLNHLFPPPETNLPAPGATPGASAPSPAQA